MVLAERIGQMLHALADQSSSYPMSMAEIVGEQQEQWTSETWKAYLHDLGSAFDTYVVLDTYDRENEQKREEVRATMRTLFDYFEALWD